MEEILHQFVDGLTHYIYIFIYKPTIYSVL
jgi:hypothetical protein